MAAARQLQDYTYVMRKLELKGDFDTAVRGLEQVKRNNESELAQAEATRVSAERAYEKERERHDRYTEQLAMCKMYAPQDGMVAYAVEEHRGGGGSSIKEGAFVRQRQKILTIPDLTRMQVKTAVHESVVKQVKKGLETFIRVDAVPGSRYRGSVETVAPLPDQGSWFSSDTQVYKTIVRINEDVERLKPGMTAVVEINVDELTDVISVPIQAIVQRGKSSWCFVNVRGKLERRNVTLGATNDKFVEIKNDGLLEGEIVALNPTSLIENEPPAEEEDPKNAEKDRSKNGNKENRTAGEADNSSGEKPPGPGNGKKKGTRKGTRKKSTDKMSSSPNE